MLKAGIIKMTPINAEKKDCQVLKGKKCGCPG